MSQGPPWKDRPTLCVISPPQCPLHCPQHPAFPFGRICNLIPQEGHPALAQLPFPAHGDSSEVYCSYEVWVKGSWVPTHRGPPTLSTDGAGPHYRELGPPSCLSRGLLVLKAGGCGLPSQGLELQWKCSQAKIQSLPAEGRRILSPRR